MLLSGCANMDARQHADQLAHNANLKLTNLEVNSFVLTSYSRIADKNQPLNVYIEGDGLAWRSRHELSLDPSPLEAVGLGLATQDPSINVVYLARPCQFNDFNKTACDSAYWSNKRFSEKVIAAMNQELEAFVQKTNTQKVNLIGYSGGAAIAVLIASRRGDIASIRTVAGNLDTEYVNQYHQVDAMPDSLNPIVVANKISHIPQLHFIGKNDKIITREVMMRFVQQQNAAHCAAFLEVDSDHQNGWINLWKNLLNREVAC